MNIEKYDFNYNVSLKTINCINDIDFTYHVSNHDYPVRHIHLDYFEFTIITKGIVLNTTKNGKRIIEKNTLFITPSNVEHYFIKKSEEISFINIVCRNKVLKEMSNLIGYDLDKLISSRTIFKIPDDLVFIIQSNIDFINSLKEEEWEKCNSVLRSTVISMLNYICLDDLKTNYNGEKWEIIMNSLKQSPEFYAFNVNQLCEKLGYSRTQLNRIFMNQYAVTPSEYLKDLKMKYAQSLLSHTDYSISEISKMVGYTNQNQFNKNFKEKYKKLPSEYRKNAEV